MNIWYLVCFILFVTARLPADHSNKLLHKARLAVSHCFQPLCYSDIFRVQRHDWYQSSHLFLSKKASTCIPPKCQTIPLSLIPASGPSCVPAHAMGPWVSFYYHSGKTRSSGRLTTLLNCPKVWKWVIVCMRRALDGRCACLLPSARWDILSPPRDPEPDTSNKCELTSLVALRMVLVWRDSCLLPYFLLCWQTTGALQISGSVQISLK